MSVTYKRSPKTTWVKQMKGNSHVPGQDEEEEGTDPRGKSEWQFWLDWFWLSLCKRSLSFQDQWFFSWHKCPPPGRGETELVQAGVPSKVRLSSSSLPCRPADCVEVHHEGHGAPAADRPPALLRHPDVRYHRLGVLQREAAPRMLHEQFRCAPVFCFFPSSPLGSLGHFRALIGDSLEKCVLFQPYKENQKLPSQQPFEA